MKDKLKVGMVGISPEALNLKALMTEGEAIGTYKLAGEQAPGTFYCPPHFSNTDIEPQPVPHGWYPLDRKKSESAKEEEKHR
uniref:Uncharacterized protein n=1 Tax=Romanomermis culicivorax TaxID=13658 RepID=A0A915I600_ROMCU